MMMFENENERASLRLHSAIEMNRKELGREQLVVVKDLQSKLLDHSTNQFGREQLVHTLGLEYLKIEFN